MYLIFDATRLLLSLLFFAAACGKLLSGFPKSRKTLSEFGVPQALLIPVSIALPVAELAIVFLLVTTGLAWIGALSATALLLLFNAAIVANLAVGKNPPCNCFGQLRSRPIGWSTLVRNTVVAGSASVLAWQERLHPGASAWRTFGGLTTAELGLVSLTLLGSTAVAILGYLVLELFRQNGRLLLRIEEIESRTVPIRAFPATAGLPIGSKAVPFDLPKVDGGRGTLDAFLLDKRPILLISTDPNCGPCNSLMHDVAMWQKTLTKDVTIVLLSHGRYSENRAKAADHGLQNVLLEKNYAIAGAYHATGTPTGVLIRPDGTVGSPALAGVDAIRQLVTKKAWTEAGFALFMNARSQPLQPVAPKPALPIGSSAPVFRLPDLAGNLVESSSFNGNGTVLLFWNPACGFCQQMLPQIKAWEQGRQSAAPSLVFVSRGTPEAHYAMDTNAKVLIDQKFEVSQLYGASGTPSAVLIDTKGRIDSVLAVGAPGIMALLQREKIESTAEQMIGGSRQSQSKLKGHVWINS